MQKLIFDADTAQLDNVLDFVNESLDGFTPQQRMQITLAVEEIFVNIANYAYGESKGKVTIRTAGNKKGFSITFIDCGVKYNPVKTPEPETDLSADEREIGGLGIFLAEKSMDSVKYKYRNGQNILTMKKYFENQAEKGNKQSITSGLITAFLCAAAFFVVTMPFRKMFSILNITEIRPVSAFPPVFGIAFGFWGAIGCSIANFAADIISDENVMLCVYGFFLQFLYGYLPYLMWKRISHGDDNERLRIGSFDMLLKYIFVVLTDSVFMTLALAVLFRIFGISDIISPLTLFLFLNNFDFCIIIGIPLLLAIYRTRLYIQCVRSGKDKKSVFHISLNERILLGIIAIGIIIGCLFGIITFEVADNARHNMLEVWNRVYVVGGVGMNVFFLISFIILHFIEKNITLPIESLAEISEKYSHKSGDLDNEMMIKECEKFCGNKTEAGHLARSYVHMLKSINAYIEYIKNMTAEKERIGAELAVAHTIQNEMLPHNFDTFSARDDFEIYADMKPAKEVGGDFYDFFEVDADHIGIAIGDVSDKGVPSAMIMTIAKTLIRNFAKAKMTPSEVFEHVNTQLCENNEESLFVTAWLGILELSSGKLSYVNAGHNQPIINHSGVYEYIGEKGGFVLGGFETTRYRQSSLVLNKGDELFLYTDGITEAENTEHTFYGEDRLLEYMNNSKAAAPKEKIDGLKKEIALFAGDAPQSDDMTMLMLKIK